MQITLNFGGGGSGILPSEEAHIGHETFSRRFIFRLAFDPSTIDVARKTIAVFFSEFAIEIFRVRHEIRMTRQILFAGFFSMQIGERRFGSCSRDIALFLGAASSRKCPPPNSPPREKLVCREERPTPRYQGDKDAFVKNPLRRAVVFFGIFIKDDQIAMCFSSP